jgi:hypothetical protein
MAGLGGDIRNLWTCGDRMQNHLFGKVTRTCMFASCTFASQYFLVERD